MQVNILHPICDICDSDLCGLCDDKARNRFEFKIEYEREDAYWEGWNDGNKSNLSYWDIYNEGYDEGYNDAELLLTENQATQ